MRPVVTQPPAYLSSLSILPPDGTFQHFLHLVLLFSSCSVLHLFTQKSVNYFSTSKITSKLLTSIKQNHSLVCWHRLYLQYNMSPSLFALSTCLNFNEFLFSKEPRQCLAYDKYLVEYVLLVCAQCSHIELILRYLKTYAILP